MPKSIDKNDVDISKLFHWGSKFTLKDRFGKELIEVYIRLVGDADLNRARIYALRKSADLRRLLKDENSDEKIAYIPTIDALTKEQLMDALILFLTRSITMDAIRAIQVKLPAELDSDATLEEQEKYQKEVDNYPITREERIREYVENKVEEKRKEFSKKDKEFLYDEYQRFLVDQLCESEMISKYREACIFYGTFEDFRYKNRLFSDMEEFENLPKEIKDQLLDAYNSLELGGEDLKKLQEVMQ